MIQDKEEIRTGKCKNYQMLFNNSNITPCFCDNGINVGILYLNWVLALCVNGVCHWDKLSQLHFDHWSFRSRQQKWIHFFSLVTFVLDHNICFLKPITCGTLRMLMATVLVEFCAYNWLISHSAAYGYVSTTGMSGLAKLCRSVYLSICIKVPIMSIYTNFWDRRFSKRRKLICTDEGICFVWRKNSSVCPLHSLK